MNNAAQSVFKETVIGDVPMEWEVAPLSEVTVKTANRNPLNEPNVTFRYIDVSSVSNETFQVSSYSELLGKDAPSRARRVVKADDTIFATVRPYLMNIARIPKNLNDSICSTGFCVIRADTSMADSRFLYFCVVSHPFVQRVVERQRGSSYPAVRDKDVLEQLIPLPPLDEQRRIAAVLTAIQDAIAAQEDVIAAARAFKRSLMHRLFTYGPGRCPAETKETEIGEIPSHWEVTTVDKTGKIITGTTPSTKRSEFYGSRHMFVGPGDIGDGVYVKTSAKYLSEQGLRHARSLPRNTVLVVCIGATIGKTAMTVKDNCSTNQQINAIIPGTSWDPRFLYDVLSYRSWELPKFAGRSAIPIVNKANFGQFKIPHTNRIEQQTIGHYLFLADAKIAAEEDRKATLDALFKSMLHQLMTGQIRLLRDEGL